MKILKSQLKQVITEELEQVLFEIDNFDGNTGEPKTVKGALICATREDCWYKWLEEPVKEMIYAEDERLKEPVWKAILARGEDGGWYTPGFYAKEPPSREKEKEKETLHPDGLVPSDEKIEKAIEKVSQKLKQNPKLVQKKIEQSPKLKKVVKAADADVTQDIDMLAMMAAADHVLKKLENEIEDLKVRVKEEPEKAAVLKQVLAKLEKKKMDKEIEIMRQMTTYGVKRQKERKNKI